MDPLLGSGPQQVGPYQLLGRLGRGGMGQVYLGRSRGGRLVAVKLILPEYVDSQRFRLKFAAEVAAARRVSGFYTAQVIDADPKADPPWLATAFISGLSLLDIVERHGALPTDSVRVLGAGLAEGLAAIHGAGLVHRDFKPGNILLAADGPRIIDFGVAHALDAAHITTSRAGTPAYMSPEQVRELPVGPASDVFALGSVLVYTATGRNTFGKGNPEAIAYRVINSEPDLTGLPASLTALVQACLAKDAATRPTLSEILDQLAVPADAAAVWLPPPVVTMISKRGQEISAQTTLPPPPDVFGLPAQPLEQPSEQLPAQPSDEPSDKPTGKPRGRRWRPGRRDVVIAGLGAATLTAMPVAFLLRSPAPAKPVATRRRPSGPTVLFTGDREEAVRSIAFSPDGTLLAAVGNDGMTRLWPLSAKRPVQVFTHRVRNPWRRPLDEIIAFNPEFPATIATAFTPNQGGLVVGNGDGTIDLWDVKTGAVRTLPNLKPKLWNVSAGCVAINSSGGTVAATCNSPNVRVWNPVTGTVRATLTTGTGFWVAAMAFHPAGKILATASGNGRPGNSGDDGLLQLWDASSHQKISTLARTNSGAHSLAFSADGRTLANVRRDGVITLWDVASRGRSAAFAGPDARVTCLACGPGGIVAGGSADGTVTLWDIASRRHLAVLSTGSKAKITCVAVSADGRNVAAGGSALTTWTIT